MATAPLQIGILNLMHDKEDTQRRFRRVLRQTGWPVQLTFLYPRSHYQNRPVPELVQRISRPLDLNAVDQFDAFIITGAPIEKIPFEQITYLEEIHQLIDRLVQLNIPQLYVCWGAMAAANYLYGIEKELLPEKLFGIYPNYFHASSQLPKGLPDGFLAPHARYAELNIKQVIDHPDLILEATTVDNRLFSFRARKQPQYFLFSHLEYGRDALTKEYRREIDAHPGQEYVKPQHYYRDPIHMRAERFQWLSTQIAFFENWLYEVSQSTHQKSLVKE